MNIKEIQAELARFAAVRDWEQYHSPKNLAMALAGEAGELVAQFQWLSDLESRNIALNSAKLARVGEEMADVFIYLVRLADVLNVDIEQVVAEKTRDNARKYPVALSKGNAVKYSDRNES